MPFAANRPAAAIEQEVNQHQALMNASRFAAPLLPAMARVAEAEKVYIFNVGPWPQRQLLGSLGQFFIQACPEGAEHSAPLVLKGIIREHYPINEMENKSLDDEGWNVAQQVLGIGPHLPPQASLIPFGVFATLNAKPTKEELAKAKAALFQKHLDNVTEADIAYSMGPKVAQETIRPDPHFISARALGKTEIDCPWLRNAVVPAERKECFNCGTPYKIGIAQCPQCKAVLDKEKFGKAVKDGLISALGQ